VNGLSTERQDNPIFIFCFSVNQLSFVGFSFIKGNFSNGMMDDNVTRQTWLETHSFLSELEWRLFDGCKR